MSLEAAIQENTLAIRELITALGAKGNKGARAEVEIPTLAKAEPKAEPKAEAPTGGVPPFNEIRDAFVSMVKLKGQQTAVDLLFHFGLDATRGGKLSAVPVERHVELMAEIKKRSA